MEALKLAGAIAAFAQEQSEDVDLICSALSIASQALNAEVRHRRDRQWDEEERARLLENEAA